MKLCWCTYNKKYILLLLLGQTKNNTCALKIQEKAGPILISDKSISIIRFGSFKSLDLKDKIRKIKSVCPEFSKIFRTYKTSKLIIKQTFPL